MIANLRWLERYSSNMDNSELQSESLATAVDTRSDPAFAMISLMEMGNSK